MPVRVQVPVPVDRPIPVPVDRPVQVVECVFWRRESEFMRVSRVKCARPTFVPALYLLSIFNKVPVEVRVPVQVAVPVDRYIPVDRPIPVPVDRY